MKRIMRSTFLGLITCLIFTYGNVLARGTPSASDEDTAATTSTDRPRVALVIGNANYPKSRLKNPVNDASDIAKSLKNHGFEVILLRDASRKDMEESVDIFTRRLQRENVVGLFYFAGHGIQIENTNYLLPIDFNAKSEADVKYSGINGNWILDKMKESGSELNLVILDACRNNPYRAIIRSMQRGLAPEEGLARMQPAAGALILYATEPGKQAMDGDGKNGIFTQNLLASLDKPGLTVEEVFKETAKGVYNSSQHQQKPWQEGSIMGDFRFSEPVKVVEEPPPSPQPVVAAPVLPIPQPIVTNGTDREFLFWETIKLSNDPADYEAYLEQVKTRQFSGTFSGLANNRLKVLRPYTVAPETYAEKKVVKQEIKQETKRQVKQKKPVETPPIEELPSSPVPAQAPIADASDVNNKAEKKSTTVQEPIADASDVNNSTGKKPAVQTRSSSAFVNQTSCSGPMCIGN